jgi:tetratricopeptide (TPR) repeat protein
VQLAFARERKDLEFAGRIVNEMERQFPNSPRVVVEKADNLILAEKWDEAMQVLTPLREKNPPNLRALHLTGRCLARSGDHAGALSVLTAANLLNPHNAARLVDIGNILLETNEFLKAKDTFDEALDMEKENRDAKVGKAKCLLLEGEVNDALELTKQLSGPRELAAIFNTTAVLSIRHGDYDKGMQLYRHAIKAVMDSKSLSARLFFNLGVAYHRQGRPKDAKAQFEKSAQLDPEFAKAIHNVRAMGQRKLAAGAEYSAPMAEESEFVDLFASQDEDEFE